jgi:hypothetical protein
MGKLQHPTKIVRHTGATKEKENPRPSINLHQQRSCTTVHSWLEHPCQHSPDFTTPKTGNPAVFCTGSWWLQHTQPFALRMPKSLNTTTGAQETSWKRRRKQTCWLLGQR